MQEYLSIISHYESCLEQHGDTHLGVDWPNKADADTRYKVMLELIRKHTADVSVSLLDFGCGLSHLYDYILQHRFTHINYCGLDISQRFIEISRAKYPQVDFYCLDILKESTRLPMFDYIILNGVFTEKCDLTFEEMLTYLQTVLTYVYHKARLGIAFNVMSKHVDWEREDLFHLPFDLLTEFLIQKLSRDFIIRNDYGLYEYTTYVYKQAKR